MTTRLIIARHGNTFTPDQIPTRVGARTDLPLVEQERSKAIGDYIQSRGWSVTKVFSGPLLRHTQTAALACQQLAVAPAPLEILDHFNEIDYGEDENKTEPEVELRLGAGDRAKGAAIIAQWNRNMQVPPGWQVQPTLIQQQWQRFAASLLTAHRDQTSLVISSNGILRFAPAITGDLATFCVGRNMKVTTGGVCVFEYQPATAGWCCRDWGIKPLQQLNSTPSTQ